MDEATISTSESPIDAAQELVEVRLLTDCQYGKCNDVVTIPAAELRSAKQAEVADDDAAAVAYAKTLRQNGGTET